MQSRPGDSKKFPPIVYGLLFLILLADYFRLFLHNPYSSIPSPEKTFHFCFPQSYPPGPLADTPALLYILHILLHLGS